MPTKKLPQPSFPLFVSACLRMRHVHALIQTLDQEHESTRAAQRERRPLPFPRIELNVRDRFVLCTTPLSEIALSFEMAFKSYLQECAYISPENREKLVLAGSNHPFPAGTRLPGVDYRWDDQFLHEHRSTKLVSDAVECMQQDGKDPDALASRLIQERHPAWDRRHLPYLSLKEHIRTFGGLYDNMVNLRYCASMDPPEISAVGEIGESALEGERQQEREKHQRDYPNLSAALNMIGNAGSEVPRSQHPPMHYLCYRFPDDGSRPERFPVIFSMLTCLSYWQVIMELALDKIIEHDAAIYPLYGPIDDVGVTVHDGTTYNVRALAHYLEDSLKLFDPQTDLGIEGRIETALDKAYMVHEASR